MCALLSSSKNNNSTGGKIKAAYNKNIGRIGEYLAYSFLTEQSRQKFSTCDAMSGKVLQQLTRPNPSTRKIHGSDLFAFAMEQDASGARALIPQVFEVKTNSAIDSEANLSKKQQTQAGIKSYIDASMQSLKKKFPKNASDICIHAYLIHITGVIDWESFGVFLDLYDWNKLTLANIDKVSLQNPNAREHLLGTWVLSNSLYVYGEEYENEGEEWNGAYTPKDTGGISQPIDTKNAELGIKSINGKRYISKPFRYMTKLMGGNLNNMTKKNLQKLDWRTLSTSLQTLKWDRYR